VAASLEHWRERFEATPYVRRLGCAIEALEPDRARLRLPYLEANSNPGKALHGGIHASLLCFAGSLAAESGLDAALDLEAGPLDLSVAYLAAAIGEEVLAEGSVLRRGRDIVFCQATVRNLEGRALAQGMLTYRAVERATAERAAASDPEPRRVDADAFVPGPLDPGPMGRAIARAPFIGSTLTIDHMKAGRAVLSMEPRPELLDASGSHHAGALAALVDTAGAMASWSLVPLGNHKAMTPGIQVSYVAPSRGERVRALAENVRKHAESFSNRIEVVGAKSGRLVAQGLLTYRIVVGETLPGPAR
jgi:uncharacterized protein (TIGR00369 family)